MPQRSASDPPMSARVLAHGDGWRVQDVICAAGPEDRRFEEQHAWTSIAVVLSGVFTYRTHQGGAVLAPGGLLLGEAGRCFECGHEHGAGDRCVSFHLSPDLIDDVLGGLDRAARPGFASPALPPIGRLSPLIAEARSLTRSADPLRAEQIALDIASAAFVADRDAAAAPVSSREAARAAQAVRLIEAKLGEPLTIAGLAREVGMTRRRFATSFRRVVGVTPYAYVLSRRLDAAAEHLACGAASVLDAALEAGFGDLSEFTRRFRARFGAPPGLYRRQARAPGRPPQ